MADPAAPYTGFSPGHDTLRQLHEQGVTGILRLRSTKQDDLDLYLMDGSIISACSMADDWFLARLLVAGAALQPATLAKVLDGLGGDSLPDALMMGQHLALDVLARAQEECFRQTVVSACVTTFDSADFAIEEAVFPPNMQLGVHTGGFLRELLAWHTEVGPLLILADRPTDPLFQVTGIPSSDDPDAERVAGLCVAPTAMSHVLARSPLVPYRTLSVLADLVTNEILTISVKAEENGALVSMTGELSDVLEATGSGEFCALSAEHIRSLGDEDEVATFSDLPVQAVEPEQPQEIDYDHVEAGGHAKVYEVLDKVDLSHVDDFPTGPTPTVETLDDDGEDLVVAAAEESIEIGGEEVFGEEFVDSGDPDALSESGDPEEISEDSDMVVEIPIDYPSDTDSNLEAPPIHLSGTEDAFELSIDDEDGEFEEAIVTSDRIPASAFDQVPTGLTFTPEQIRSFDHRIRIFNQIFRVVFETFRTPLGDAAVLKRFDRFLHDESLQYPDLFREMHVSDDGTLGPGPLIRNLAAANPPDAEAFLHQGLYELIYVHLYDAKDVLSPDEEQSMMDQIAEHEEKLHQ